MMMDGAGGAGWVIVTVLALVSIGAVVAWAAARPREAADGARQILDERFARGEIDLEEYRGRRDTIARTGSTRRAVPSGPLLVVAAFAFIGVVLVASTAGFGGTSWPAWMQTMHDQMWGGRRDGAGQAPPPVEGAREIRVVADEFSFEPNDLRIRAGETVNVVIDNRGTVFHDFYIEDLDFELDADPGDRATGALTAPRQSQQYTIVCDVPGHASAGMRATLTVEAAPR